MSTNLRARARNNFDVTRMHIGCQYGIQRRVPKNIQCTSRTGAGTDCGRCKGLIANIIELGY